MTSSGDMAPGDVERGQRIPTDRRRIGDPGPTRKDRVAAWVSLEEKIQIQAAAEIEGMSVSELLRALVLRHARILLERESCESTKRPRRANPVRRPCARAKDGKPQP